MRIRAGRCSPALKGCCTCLTVLPRLASTKAAERYLLHEMNPTDHSTPQDSDPLERMTRTPDSGVGVIVETSKPCALLAPRQRIVVSLFEPIG